MEQPASLTMFRYVKLSSRYQVTILCFKLVDISGAMIGKCNLPGFTRQCKAVTLVTMKLTKAKKINSHVHGLMQNPVVRYPNFRLKLRLQIDRN
jgi:hypothetical protein